MAGLERGLHILCEKPLGMSAREAREMTEAAERAGVTTMTSFTYRFMPANRYLKALVDEGYIGRPYHLNLRYYSGYGRSGEYAWRFDVGESGGGVSGDLASHWGDHARWLFGEIEAVTAVFSYVVPRGPRPDGAPFEVGEDAAMLLLEFESGARGSIHVTSLAYEPGPFGHRQEMDLHGSDGTLRLLNDWLTVQRIDGSRPGEPVTHELPIPDELFAGARASDRPRDVQGRVPRAGQHDARVRLRGRTRREGVTRLRGRPRGPAAARGRRQERPRRTPRADRGDHRRGRLMHSCHAGGPALRRAPHRHTGRKR